MKIYFKVYILEIKKKPFYIIKKRKIRKFEETLKTSLKTVS